MPKVDMASRRRAKRLSGSGGGMQDHLEVDNSGSEDRDHGFGQKLKETLTDAGNKIAEVVGVERVSAAGDATRKGLAGAGKVYRHAEGAVTQSEAWDEANAVLDDLVEVARSQHALILDLLERVSALEERVVVAASAVESDETGRARVSGEPVEA